MNNRYKIADIAIEVDSEGNYQAIWIGHLGWHASQGGLDWGFADKGCKNIDHACDALKRYLNKDFNDILERAKEVELKKED